jgi:hypothetical protein
VYSFGIVVWEIYSGGATPYTELQASEVVRTVLAGHRLSRPHLHTSEHIISIIRACTGLVPEDRPTMMAVHAQLSGSWALDEPLAVAARSHPPVTMATNALYAGEGDDMESAL